MNKKILVIEDNKVLRENICALLAEEGYTVLSGMNGMEGLNKFKEFLPDLVLCDIKMPGMDGYELLLKLSKDNSIKPVPFIFLTAKVEKEDIHKGLNLGAVEYLFKPFDSDILLDCIAKNLEKK